ncbi:hypothetical protein [Avibacterium volantium]|uniref:Uncharacterized protein n=3 Tax=Avibacterium TaxID=292486 RepID=A0A447SRX8_AVIVO|nr:hypothetical protein [Avibacterium volantium]VEB24593.1 Uncharacterised protein [Avibacterium volantium]
MSYRIKAQVGKTNISGNGNNVNQTGNINLNNSNNTTINNNFIPRNKINGDDTGEFIIFSIILVTLIFFLPILLLKYPTLILTLIKYYWMILLLPLFTFFKNRNYDYRLIVYFIVITISTGVIFYSQNIFSIQEFLNLSSYAKNMSITQFWKNLDNYWRILVFYFLINITITIALLLANTILVISFYKISKGDESKFSYIKIICNLALVFSSLYLYLTPENSIKFIAKYIEILNKPIELLNYFIK